MKVLLELKLDGLPPTVNSMYRSMKGGQRYKTAACRSYQEQTVRLIQEHYHAEPSTSRLELIIEFQVKDKRRWDIDNRVKALQDCLTNAGVLKDDSQIDSLQIRRVYSNVSSTYLRLCEYETKAA